MMEIGLGTGIRCPGEILDETTDGSTASGNRWWGIVNDIIIELAQPRLETGQM